MAISPTQKPRVASKAVGKIVSASPVSNYTVILNGFLAGTFRKVGQVIRLSARAAEYPVRAGQIALVAPVAPVAPAAS